MKILGVESSATSASATVLVDGKVLSSQFTNTGLTHSQTLLPMAVGVLSSAKLNIADIDCIAVSKGPGSFTGVRIGVAAVKGLAFPNNTPCLGVSTLEVIAEPLRNSNCFAVALMDARCNQFYTATFRCENGVTERVTEDRAISFEELSADLATYRDKPIVFIGDGALVAYQKLTDEQQNGITLASPEIRYQNAASLCVLAERYLSKNSSLATDPKELLPCYLRLSQAERELKLKKDKN